MRQSHGLIPYINLRAGGVPLYEQLYKGLRNAIRDGRLPPGTRLPSTRTLAEDLDVARMTVTRAYDQLKTEGYVDAGVGSGTWVAEEIPDRLLRTPASGATPLARRNGTNGNGTMTLSERGRRLVELATPVRPNAAARPFKLEVPEVDHFPFRVWSALEKEEREQEDAFQAADPRGEAALRKAVAHFVAGTRGGHVNEDQVVVTPGTKESATILAELLLDPADVVALEDPGCPIARAIFEPVCDVVSVPVDDDGMVVPEDLLEGASPRLVLTTPSNQFPLGVAMSTERRREILDWAAGTDTWIVEHDYDGEYRFTGRPLPSLLSLDEVGRVIYMSGFKKLMAPMFEAGFVILPPDLVEPFVSLMSLRARRRKTLPQRVMARFISEGHMARHVRTSREVFKSRRDRLVEVLRVELGSDVEIGALDAGAHLIVWLPAGISADDTAAHLESAGVKGYPMSRFTRRPLARDGLVLGYGGFEEEDLATAAFQISIAIG